MTATASALTSSRVRTGGSGPATTARRTTASETRARLPRAGTAPRWGSTSVGVDGCGDTDGDGLWDDDGDGIEDEDCFLRFLAIGWLYDGDDETFEQQVRERFDFFFESLDLQGCPQDISLTTIIPPSEVMLTATDPHCATVGSRGCADLVDEYDALADSGIVPSRTDFSAVGIFTNFGEPGLTGGESFWGPDAVFVRIPQMDSDDHCVNSDHPDWQCGGLVTVLAHEFGHLLGLMEEYTYDPGSIYYINHMDPELGCDASDGGSCCWVDPAYSDSYGQLCDGNRNCLPNAAGECTAEAQGDGRCIMSRGFAGQRDADDPVVERGWCAHCWNHLKQLDPLPSSGEGLINIGRAIRCDQENRGRGPMLTLDVHLSSPMTVDRFELVEEEVP